jgi:hypothetical protein
MGRRKRLAKSVEIRPTLAQSSSRERKIQLIPLAMSVVLFAIWFIFLLVTALST